MKFTIRDLLWLMLVIRLALAHVADRRWENDLRRRNDNLTAANKALIKELEATKGRVRLRARNAPGTKTEFEVFYDEKPSTDVSP